MDTACIGQQRYRLLVLGSGQVGKTCLIRRYLHNTYNDRYKETVEDIYPREFHICGSILPLDIYDTNFYYPDMRRVSIASADAFMLVFAVDDVNSFKSVTDLVQEIEDRRQTYIDDLPMVLVGSKSDSAEKKIYPETVQVWLKHSKKSFPYFESSAKTGDNVVEIFKSLLDQSGFPNCTKTPADIERRRRMLQQSRATTIAFPPQSANGGVLTRQKPAPPKRQSSQVSVRCLSAGRHGQSTDEDDECLDTIQDETEKSLNEKRISRFTKQLSMKKLATSLVTTPTAMLGPQVNGEAKVCDRKRGVLTRHGSLMKKTQMQRLSLKMKRPTIDEPDESDCKIS